MSADDWMQWAVYLAALLVAWVPYTSVRRRRSARIESRLTARLGEVGKKLHTARSRNEQVARDVRLFLAEEVEGLIHDLAALRLAGVAGRIITRTSSRPATPTCSGPSRYCLPTTSWPMTRCGAGTWSACTNP